MTLSPILSLSLLFSQPHYLSFSHTHRHTHTYLPTQQHGSAAADLAINSEAQVDRSRVQRVSTEAADTSACLISRGNRACSIYFLAEMQSGAGSWQGSIKPAIRCSSFTPTQEVINCFSFLGSGMENVLELFADVQSIYF